MRQKLRQEARRPSTGQHGCGATHRERRGNLLGAEPRPGPGRPWRPAVECVQVLVGLANHAGPDGTGAFPSVATLVRYTGLSERTVRTCLDQLAAADIIAPCDPGIVAARIKRADRRPQGWDLNLSLVRDDLAAPSSPYWSISSQGWALGSPRPLTVRLAGCTHRIPLPPTARLWMTGPTGCSFTPEPGTGCNQRAGGV